MRFERWSWVACLAVWFCGSVSGRSDFEGIIPDAPPLAKSEQVTQATKPSLFGHLNDQQLLLVGLRMDVAYTTPGHPVPGFSVPSVRLTSWGQAGDLLSYRFSLGQTREFSNSPAPQLIPVEAFIDFHSATAMDWNPRSKLTWRLGLFTPTFNPWWSPDLADIPLPDFHESHRSLFVNRDIGTELLFEPVADRLVFHFGLYNGSGIVNLNTQDSKAIAVGMRGTLVFGSWRWMTGFSGGFREQASLAAAGFRSEVMGNLYTLLEHPERDIRLTVELMGAEVTEALNSWFPLGMAATVHLPIYSGLRLFGRVEWLEGTEQGLLRHAQLGPVFRLHPAIEAYLLYQYLERGNDLLNAGWLRARLNL